jgi:hypothetical protein
MAKAPSVLASISAKHHFEAVPNNEILNLGHDDLTDLILKLTQVSFMKAPTGYCKSVEESVTPQPEGEV